MGTVTELALVPPQSRPRVSPEALTAASALTDYLGPAGAKDFACSFPGNSAARQVRSALALGTLT